MRRNGGPTRRWTGRLWSMNEVLRYLGRRLLFLPFAMLGVITLSFALVNLLPSDPAHAIAGADADRASVQVVRTQLGLDKPLSTRYVHYLDRLAHGDLGTSYFEQKPVGTAVWQRATSSLVLIVPSLLLGIAWGTFVGGTGAYFRRRWPDRVSRLLISSSQAVPDFLLGVLLIYVFFFVLRVAPSPVGQLSITMTPPKHVTGAAVVDSLLAGRLDAFRDALGHAVLPVITLAAVVSAYFGRTVRSTLGDALGGPATEFARGCGLSERRVVLYAFRESRTPLITYIGIVFASLLGGAAIVETVFAWDGLGQWALKGVAGLDLPVIQAFVLVVGSASLLVYILLEAAVTLSDPRLSFSNRGQGELDRRSRS